MKFLKLFFLTCAGGGAIGLGAAVIQSGDVMGLLWVLAGAVSLYHGREVL